MNGNEPQAPGAQPQIDFVSLLYDFERRLKEGMIKLETKEGKTYITVLQKDSFEKDKTIGEVSEPVSSSQYEKLTVIQDIRVAQLKVQMLTAMEQYAAQIADAEKLRDETLVAVRDALKKFEESEAKKEASDKKPKK